MPMSLTFPNAALRALALLPASFAAAVHAQAPLPQPNLALLDNGPVTAFARQPDGGTIIAGQFTSVDGLPRNGLARVRPDGAIDPDWNPAPDAAVDALAVDANGNVYAGGTFQSIGGAARAYLAKLAGGGSGQADATWNPSPDSSVTALALDGANALYVGGWFENIGGQPRPRLAK
ncbi:MAG TPA: delta-60 repeat domain-containing protein, partial [Rhodanobacteraceae bacterium]|nr:delta-60 repeat domain-containing protein [Rhodanobacteraceae bacterium]